MRTEDGRWSYRYDRALPSPSTLRLREPEALWRSCENIEVPTLIVRGEVSDILSPQTADRMVRTIADARLTTVANAGHGVPHDSTDVFWRPCTSF
jgi:pimeloyl-ACP methyl ester carboxylesterase